MKRLFFLASLGILAISIYAFSNPSVDFESNEEGGIQFRKVSWAEALKLSKQENKPIFLDIYASWCSHCKKLKKVTFADKSVGDYYNEHFINVALNGEEGEGVILYQRYLLEGYPSLLFVDSTGAVLAQSAGYKKPKDFLKFGHFTLK